MFTLTPVIGLSIAPESQRSIRFESASNRPFLSGAFRFSKKISFKLNSIPFALLRHKQSMKRNGLFVHQLAVSAIAGSDWHILRISVIFHASPNLSLSFFAYCRETTSFSPFFITTSIRPPKSGQSDAIFDMLMICDFELLKNPASERLSSIS